MEISILTGLPELPEGQFWRVEGNRSALFNMFGSETYAYVTIVRKREVHSTREREYRIPLFDAVFTWGTEPYTEVVEDELISMAVIKTVIKPVNVYDEDGVEKIGVRDEEVEERVTIDNLTPDLILETAKRALARLNEINTSHELIGDYPPKKLEI